MRSSATLDTNPHSISCYQNYNGAYTVLSEFASVNYNFEPGVCNFVHLVCSEPASHIYPRLHVLNLIKSLSKFIVEI